MLTSREGKNLKSTRIDILETPNIIIFWKKTVARKSPTLASHIKEIQKY
jgi:hypothetical protein